MAKRVTTLYIRDTVINLLVAKGKLVEKWASLPLEPGMVSQGLIQDEAQIASRVKELFKLEKIKPTNVIVGLSGFNSVYRVITLPELPEAILHEAVRHEAGRALPMSLDEVHLAYQPVPAPKGETRVFLAAFPRNTADTLLSTLHQAELEPYVMDLAPLALSRIPDEPRAIIISARLEHLDIIIIEDRLPQVIRRLALPSEAESLEEKLPAITEELGRTVAFYNSSHLEMPIDTTVPVFVCGELAEVPESWQSLVSTLGYSVSPLTSPMEFPEAFSPNEFMVNIGLALKELPREKEGANFSLVNFNALPGAYVPKALPLSRILVPAGIVVGVGLLAFLGLSVQSTGTRIDELNSQLATTDQRIVQHQKEIATLKTQIEQAEAEIPPVEATTAIFNTTHTSLGEGRGDVDGDLSRILGQTLLAVDVTQVSHRGDAVTVSGIAPDEGDIFGYARDLRASGRFSSVIISAISQMTREVEIDTDPDETETETIKLYYFAFELIN